MNEPTAAQLQFFERVYVSFNARDIDATLGAMHADVEWPNGMEGGYVYGHAAVRDYFCGIDVDLRDRGKGLPLLRQTLVKLHVPKGTVLQYEANGREFEQPVDSP